MTRLPWHHLLPIAAGLSYGIPVIAALRAGAELSAALIIVAIYCGLALVESCIMIALTLRGTMNLWLIHVFTPIEVVLVLLAFSRWQVRESSRTMLLSIIPLFLVTWAFLLATADSLAEFPIYGRTLAALLIIAVAAYTLLVQSQHAATLVTSYPWFWVSVGLLVYFPYLVLLNPLSATLRDRRDDLIFTLYQANGALMILSNFFITWAIRCQMRHSSGGSSSQRLSPA